MVNYIKVFSHHWPETGHGVENKGHRSYLQPNYFLLPLLFILYAFLILYPSNGVAFAGFSPSRSARLNFLLLSFYSLRLTIHLIRCLISLYSDRPSGRAPSGEPIDRNASFNFPALDNPTGLEKKKKIYKKNEKALHIHHLHPGW